MKITPISIKPITFGEGNLNNINSNVGFLSLQNSDKSNFEKNLKLTQDADAVQTNVFKAIGNKFKKAYQILFSNHAKEYEYKYMTYMA